MSTCYNCSTKISDNSWFCDYCGSERSDCIECGSRVRFHQCSSCSAAPEAPCEECGSLIGGDVRECPHCGYDAGEEYEEKADSWSHSKLLYIIGGAAVIFLITQLVISIMSGFLPEGIFRTGFQFITWIFAIISIGAYLLIGGGLSLIMDSWGSHRESQAERASAADIERAERDNKSEEYKEEMRRKREREREKQKKKQEQRSRDYIQCPNCGGLVQMTVAGQVTNVKSSSDSGNLGGFGTALDTMGSDNTKDCPRCDETVMIETEVV